MPGARPLSVGKRTFADTTVDARPLHKPGRSHTIDPPNNAFGSGPAQPGPFQGVKLTQSEETSITRRIRFVLPCTLLASFVLSELGGGPKPKRNSRTHQHRRDVRT